MDEFQYSPLENASTSIRVLTLVPGFQDSDIRIVINHEVLLPTSSSYSQRRRRLEDILESLPTGWGVLPIGTRLTVGEVFSKHDMSRGSRRVVRMISFTAY
ncbi:hypothetical protein GGR57DRAFT_392635 [Xylariaceae sp. FL1272]|nr:hypothetical protein GGR57DRAFT_392635 [Xylariaceae sp. FL1272]